MYGSSISCEQSAKKPDRHQLPISDVACPTVFAFQRYPRPEVQIAGSRSHLYSIWPLSMRPIPALISLKVPERCHELAHFSCIGRRFAEH
jgi:hypothetical protein